MATIKRFEDLEIWQKARILFNQIKDIANETDLKNDFRLKDQIKASSGSIMDNIAEGFERDGNMEFRQFLSIAKGSAGEARSQIYRVYDNKYISEEKLKVLVDSFEKLSKRISAFIAYLKKMNLKETSLNKR